MFDFDDLNEDEEAEQEELRRAEEEKTRVRREALEERRRAEQEQAKLQQIQKEERTGHLKGVRAEIERAGFTGNWSDDPEILKSCFARAKDWMLQGMQSLKGEASKYQVPTGGLPFNSQERNVLLLRMWACEAWERLSKEQLQEECNRRWVPFFLTDDPRQLKQRLVYDAYGGGIQGFTKPPEVRNSWALSYQPKGKDDPAPDVPWTGQPVELGPAPDRGGDPGRLKGKGKGIGKEVWRSMLGGLDPLPKPAPVANSAAMKAAPPKAAAPKAASPQGASTKSPSARTAGTSERVTNFLKVFPAFSGELPTEEEDQQWTNIQMHSYFKSGGKVKPAVEISPEQLRVEGLRQRDEQRKRVEQQRREAEQLLKEKKIEEERKREEKKREQMEKMQREKQEREKRLREEHDREQRKHQEQMTNLAKLSECYSILGVAPDAKFPEVRRAYRTMALQFHPDKQKSNDTTMFRRATAAYEKICQTVTQQNAK